MRFLSHDCNGRGKYIIKNNVYYLSILDLLKAWAIDPRVIITS